MDSRELAKKIRIHCLHMTNKAGSSHIGSAFSSAEIIAVLYNEILNISPDRPNDPSRDRFILSKGHAGMAVYAALAEKGFFSKKLLYTYNQNGSPLCGHITHKGVPGIEASTGSLGHGLAIATGIAYAAKNSGKNFRIFCLLSDGECDEGSNWEAFIFAPHHKLDNLTVIIDYNKIQSLAPVQDTLKLDPLPDKFKDFGWEVREVDGHNVGNLKETFNKLPFKKGKPNCIIAHTIKGKGVSFMEGKVLWHYRCPKGEEFKAALEELERENA